MRAWGLAMAAALTLVGWLFVGNYAPTLYVFALVFVGIAVVRPKALTPIREGFEWATLPIRWTVSTVILSAIFVGILTPLGLVLRALGRIGDGPARESYWVDRDPKRDRPERAFRQS